MREAWRRGRKADGTPSDILWGGAHANIVSLQLWSRINCFPCNLPSLGSRLFLGTRLASAYHTYVQYSKAITRKLCGWLGKGLTLKFEHLFKYNCASQVKGDKFSIKPSDMSNPEHVLPVHPPLPHRTPHCIPSHPHFPFNTIKEK